MLSESTSILLDIGTALRELRECFGDDWKTIGGHADGKGHRHSGGTPVKINDGGKIIAGPKKLEGRNVNELGGTPESEVEIVVDPTKEEVLRLLHGSRYKRVRGAWDEKTGTAYFWNAENMEHGSVFARMQKRGINTDNMKTAYYGIQDGEFFSDRPGGPNAPKIIRDLDAMDTFYRRKQ